MKLYCKTIHTILLHRLPPSSIPDLSMTYCLPVYPNSFFLYFLSISACARPKGAFSCTLVYHSRADNNVKANPRPGCSRRCRQEANRSWRRPLRRLLRVLIMSVALLAGRCCASVRAASLLFRGSRVTIYK